MENQYLIHARTAKLWTPEEASERVGVTTRTYHRWEAGTHVPTMTTLKLLCIAFGENPGNPVKPEFLGYIVEKDHTRQRPPEAFFLFTNHTEKPTDELAQAHEGLVESLRRSLKIFSGTRSREEDASESEMLMRTVLSLLTPWLDIASAGASMWLCDRVSKLKTIGTCCGSQITCWQYLAIVYAEIESWNEMIDEDYQATEAYLLTRRMALENLALLLAPFMTAVQLLPHDDFVAKAFITQCAPCIVACDYLLKGDGLTTVEHLLPQYLRQLTKLAKSPSPFQKEAAYLATQAYCLMNTVKHHRCQFRERVAICQQAVKHAQVTGDSVLVATALTHLGDAWVFFGQPEKYLEAYQEAERLIPTEPPFFPLRLQSCIYIGLSYIHAYLGQKQEAEDYLDLANKISLPLDDDLFIPYLDYDLSVKIWMEGLVHRKLGELEEKKDSPDEARFYFEKAAAALAQMEQLPRSAGFPELDRIGMLNERALVAVRLGNMKSFMRFFKEGSAAAKASGSKRRIKEAMRNLRAAKKRWKHEYQVMKLDVLLV